MTGLSEHPEATPSDVGRELMIAAFGCVPYVGPLIAFGVARVWADGHQQRIEKFIFQLNQRLTDIEDRIESDRIGSDAVLSSASIAAQAVATSDDEKIAYLANALANVINDPEITHDAAVIQLRLISDLTATHLLIMEIADDPQRWERKTGRSTMSTQSADELFYPDSGFSNALGLDGVQPDIRLVLQDLEARGLLNSIGMGNPAGHERPQSVSVEPTSSGRRILSFVKWEPHSQGEN